MIETLRQLDHQLFYLINHSLANPVLDFLCPVFRSKASMAFVYCLIAYGLYSQYPRQFIKIATAGALAYLLTDQLSAHVIKSLVHRLRPCNNPAIGARLLLEHCGNGLSFVSAHAANTFGTATMVGILSTNKKFGVAAVIWAAVVSFSQVYVGVHFPADVIGGALLGIATGCSIGYILKTKFDQHGAKAPLTDNL